MKIKKILNTSAAFLVLCTSGAMAATIDSVSRSATISAYSQNYETGVIKSDSQQSTDFSAFNSSVAAFAPSGVSVTASQNSSITDDAVHYQGNVQFITGGYPVSANGHSDFSYTFNLSTDAAFTMDWALAKVGGGPMASSTIDQLIRLSKAGDPPSSPIFYIHASYIGMGWPWTTYGLYGDLMCGASNPASPCIKPQGDSISGILGAGSYTVLITSSIINNQSSVCCSSSSSVGFNLALAPSTVPVPATGWLLGSALVGLGGVARKRKVRQ
jgi:hypothetical protein